MQMVKQFFEVLPSLSMEHLVVLVALTAMGVAAYALHVVFHVARGRGKNGE